jgi:iron complex outermembrane receptor protein
MSCRQAGFLATLLAASAALAPSTARGQNPDSISVLSAVRVTVSRDVERSTLDLPYAISRLALDSARAATRRGSLTEALLFVPGVVVSNRYNPTQDPRLAIRGFGARSAFGIRGVRVLRDGIPLTVADGQTAVDFMDLESLGAAELFRGSAGALYGNSSGGVVDFRATPPPEAGGRAALNGWTSGDISRLSLSGGRRMGELGLAGILTRNAGEGPRDYSKFETTTATGDARWTALGNTAFQLSLSWYDAPEAQNPGALTEAEMDADPTLPDSNNIVKKARKLVDNTLVSLQAAREFGKISVIASGQAGWRTLENPQSFAIIDLDRATSGASIRALYTGGSSSRPFHLTAGADLLNQTDDRQNYTNCAGLAVRPPATCPGNDDRGSQTVNQEERVRGLGAYVRGELAVSSDVSVTGALRSDQTRFAVTDRRQTDPALAEPPPRTLSAVTPMLGINWRIGALMSAYASVSSSFETPTTTELANSPTGVGGLNADLKPQRGVTYEAGLKGGHSSGVRYDVSLFTIQTEDELIPFQVPGAGAGRVYYENAGQTTRKGLEAGLSGTAGLVSLGASAMWLQYVYDDFVLSGVSYNGNRVPGVAPVTVNAYASVQPRWGLVAIELMHAGKLAVNNANTAWADAYDIVNARLAWRPSTSFAMEPVIGVENLFDQTWASNVVVNATGGRYYEPGPGRTFYVGLRMGTR